MTANTIDRKQMRPQFSLFSELVEHQARVRGGKVKELREPFWAGRERRVN
jgi:hypothetical protein